jgi:hypothetical protein
MLSPPLLVLSLALAPSSQSYRFDVYAAGHLDVTTFDNATGYRNLGGRGGLGVGIYLRRLNDDDAPPSLQTYLQRTPMLHVDGGGGGSNTSWTDPVPNESASHGWADVSISGYAHWLFAAAHVGVDYVSSHSHLYRIGGGTVDARGTSLAIPVDATLGGRWRDTLITVGWGVSPTRNAPNDVPADFTVPFWGGARASVTTVLVRRLQLDAGVQVLENGAAAGGGAALYLLRRLGFAASIKGGHQSHTDVVSTSALTTTLDYVGFSAGVVVWPAANVFADLHYDFEWDSHGVAIDGSSAPSSPVSYYNTLRMGIGFRH